MKLKRSAFYLVKLFQYFLVVLAWIFVSLIVLVAALRTVEAMLFSSLATAVLAGLLLTFALGCWGVWSFSCALLIRGTHIEWEENEWRWR